MWHTQTRFTLNRINWNFSSKRSFQMTFDCICVASSKYTITYGTICWLFFFVWQTMKTAASALFISIVFSYQNKANHTQLLLCIYCWSIHLYVKLILLFLLMVIRYKPTQFFDSVDIFCLHCYSMNKRHFKIDFDNCYRTFHACIYPLLLSFFEEIRFETSQKWADKCLITKQ